MYAISGGHLSIVKLLIEEYDVDPKFKDTFGYSSIFIAA